MTAHKTNSEKILDQLAEGTSFEELQKQGYDKKDLLTAALFGVAELHEEYVDLLRKYSPFRNMPD